MAYMLPSALAQILNNADDAQELKAFDRLVLVSADIMKRHPVHYAMALRRHYNAQQLLSFAMPGSKCKNDKREYPLDWRQMPIKGNEMPIFDWWERKDAISGVVLKGQWYREFVESLSIGQELLKGIKMLEMCASPDKNPGLATLNTMVVLPTTNINHDGTPEYIEVDARTMDPAEREGALTKQNGFLTTLTRGYRRGAAIFQQWDRIEQHPAFKDNLEIEWNWLDPENESRGLSNNNVPFLFKAFATVKDKEGKDQRRHLYSAPVSMERFLSLDLDGVVAAAEQAGRKPSVRELIDSKWKRPDDRTDQGQGATPDAKRTSRIKVQGDNSMKDVLTESVAFFANDETVTAFKHYVNSMKPEEKEHAVYDLVELYHLLDKIVNDDMEMIHQRVVDTEKARADDERRARAQAETERKAAESAPSQRELQRV
jgi:hypothetical protein